MPDLGDAALGGADRQPATGQLTSLVQAASDASTLKSDYGGALLESEAWSGALSGTVNVTYDANFWPTTQTVTAGAASSAATYHYDDDGLVEDVVIGSQMYDLTPDAATGLLEATTLGSLATTASHNAHAELDSTRATVGGASLYAAQYGRDALGRITRWTETVQGQTTDREFEYDVLGRLWQVRDAAADAQLERYAYGVNGNRDTAFVAGGSVRYATYDAQDRQLSDGSATFTYTGAGERRRRIDGAASQTTTYDALGNLRSVELSDGTAITYVVDGRNRRIGRKVNGTWTQRWLYQNALSVVAELDGAGALKKRFVYASRGHVPDVMVVKNAGGPDNVYRLVTDHLGSVRLVVNATSGFVAQRLSYDAWGNVTEDTSPGYQPFGYAGGLYDAAPGLVRFGARDYDARTGRWLSKDPAGFAGRETDLFAYASADPVNAIDPTGAVPIDVPPWTAGDVADPEVREFFKQSLGDPLAAFADGVIPGLDPLEAAGVYRATRENGLCYSRTAGEWTRDAELLLAGRLGVGKGGFLNSNRYLRIGFSRHGGRRVFRVGGGLVEKLLGRKSWDIWKGGPL